MLFGWTVRLADRTARLADRTGTPGSKAAGVSFGTRLRVVHGFKSYTDTNRTRIQIVF